MRDKVVLNKSVWARFKTHGFHGNPVCDSPKNWDYTDKLNHISAHIYQTTINFLINVQTGVY